MTKSLSKKVIVTDDGALRYYRGNRIISLVSAAVGLYSFWLVKNPTPFSPTIPVIISVVGLGCIYLAIVLAVNYIEFRTNAGELLVRQKMLPWPGNKSVPTMEIDTLFIETTENSYVVSVILKSGSTLGLASVSNPEDAKTIIHELEKMLGLPIKVFSET